LRLSDCWGNAKPQAAYGTDSQVITGLDSGIAGPSAGVRGQPLTFTLTADEDGATAGTVFTYRIDWDGNGTVDQVVSGPSGTTRTRPRRSPAAGSRPCST
jgi:hypothetical protein